MTDKASENGSPVSLRALMRQHCVEISNEIKSLDSESSKLDERIASAQETNNE